MRVLCLTRFDRRGASSRYRFFQYIPYLEQAGLRIDVAPLLDDAYLAARYAGCRPRRGPILRSYLSRLRALWQADRYDLVWLEKEALPWLPGWLEAVLLRRPRRAALVVDYDDAEFHRYDQHHARLVRLVLGGKIGRVMRQATVVVAGNSYIADYANAVGARRVEVLPTVVDLRHYRPRPHPAGDNPFTVGWIGTPVTSRFLQTVTPALERLDLPLRVVAVGAAADLRLGRIPTLVRPWSEDSEVDEMQQFDVGIMPLDDDAYVKGKCGLKLIQYMALRCPVVGTPVGVNQQIIQHGRNGFHAGGLDQWRQALATLAADPPLRQRMGAAGRQLVERDYALTKAAPRLLDWFEQVTSAARRAAA